MIGTTNMKRLNYLGLFVFLLSSLSGYNEQTKTNTATTQKTNSKKLIGSDCDGCEIMFFGMPTISESADTSVG